MPIQDGKYVAPIWSNNAPPAIDADELNAMSQSIEGNYPAVTKTVQAGQDLNFLDVVDVNDGVATKSFKNNLNILNIFDGGVTTSDSRQFAACVSSNNMIVSIQYQSNNIYFYYIDATTGIEKFSYQIPKTSLGIDYLGSIESLSSPIEIALNTFVFPFTYMRYNDNYNYPGYILVKNNQTSVESMYAESFSNCALGTGYSIYYKIQLCKVPSYGFIAILGRIGDYTIQNIIMVYLDQSSYDYKSHYVYSSNPFGSVQNGGATRGFSSCMYDDTHCIITSFEASNGGTSYGTLYIAEMEIGASSISNTYTGVILSSNSLSSEAKSLLLKSENGDVYLFASFKKASSSSDDGNIGYAKVVKSGSVYNNVTSTITTIFDSAQYFGDMYNCPVSNYYYIPFNGSSSSGSNIIFADLLNNNFSFLETSIPEISSGSIYGSNSLVFVLVSGDLYIFNILQYNSSKDAIATKSVSSGDSVDVIYSGIYKNSSITSGTNILSDGVSAKSYEDGILEVIPNIENNSYIEYITNDSSEPMININCGFRPDIVSILFTSFSGSGTYDKCYIVYKDFYITYSSSSAYAPAVFTNNDFSSYYDTGFSFINSLEGNSTYKICAYKY